ncbi:cysteine desulfurase family protein [Aquabacter sp. P-9]|uniref:cysteine desulfurase family protein n=1 Tax=Aquabacter sediminis TaxID=3029197 RepID=UPI00237E549A|nr:aminotransferase class V-fold PLP-dependent enzyme [Aquabacter sp. P-9]MDE1569492.1 aminotransferase class V-fold PLP-dependent enzyme [Aquabacter sp. P-9]
MSAASLTSPRTVAYLDHNATSPLRPAARAAFLEALEAGGNASSVHADGRAARARLERARGQVAGLLDVDPRGVTFTSGATEAACAILHPDLEIAGRPVTCDVLLVSAVEHPCVLSGHRFPVDKVEVIPVDEAGVIDLKVLENRLAALAAMGLRPYLSLMAANNETGVLQPVAEAAERVHAVGGVVHCDAVQAAGRVETTCAALQADFVTLSAHKLGGPQGAGALVAAHPDSRARVPLMAGGGQERGRRGGTQNVPSMVGFGAAAADAAAHLSAEAMRLTGLRRRLETGIVERLQDAWIAGAGAARLPNTVCAVFPGLKAETLVIALDLAHVRVSAGSACSSGKVGPSHVLAAMGAASGLGPEATAGAIRFSLGWSSGEEDVDLALAALGRAVPRLSSRPARVA